MLKRKTVWVGILAILVVLLILSNVYFISKLQEPALIVRVGIPTFDENYSLESVYYSESLESKSEINTVVLAVMNATPIPDTAVKAELPDAVLMVVNPVDGIGYQYSFWLEDDSIIIATNAENPCNCKEISSSYVRQLKEIIESRIATLNK